MTFAGSSGLAKAYSPEFRAECVQNRGDAYDWGWIVPVESRSPYRGQCIDTSVKRPAILISATRSGIRFANFQYRGRFYIAEIPPHAVQSIRFLIENFKKVLGVIQPAHTELRFILKKGQDAILTPQYGSGRRVRLRDIVLSVDYMAPSGVAYSVLRGMGEVYMNAYRFIDTRERALEAAGKKHVVRQYLLKVPERHLDETLWAGISLSNDRGLGDVYNTLSLNCTTEAFRILYYGMGLPVPRHPWRPGNLLNPVSSGAIKELRRMGLIDNHSEIESLNEDFGF